MYLYTKSFALIRKSFALLRENIIFFTYGNELRGLSYAIDTDVMFSYLFYPLFYPCMYFFQKIKERFWLGNSYTPSKTEDARIKKQIETAHKEMMRLEKYVNVSAD